MAQTLKFGNKVWAAKEDSVLAYNDINNNYKPLPFTFSRASIGTRVNKDGLIETMGQDIARIDYTDSADGVLLLEPSRTNSLVQSNQFDTTWTLSNTSVVGNQTGVGGSANAWKLTANSGSGEKKIFVSASSGTQSLSVYAKKGTRDYLYLRGVTGNFNKRVFFNLSNGIIGTNEAVSAEIFNMGNGWYRCNAVFNQDGGYEFQIGIAENDNTATYTDDGTGNIYIQYAQAEVGSYPTSYIPTSGSTVTRAAETCNNSGNSEVFNDSEGVLFVDVSALADDNTARYLSISDGSFTNRVSIFFSNVSNQIGGRIVVGGSSIFLTATGQTQTNYNKIALKWKVNDYELYINGFGVAASVLGSTFPESTLSEISFNDGGTGVAYMYAKTKELGCYDTALTDAELETLTSYRNWVSMVNELNLNIIYNG
jgi:hypothetical protein